jgi:hypothetical protein
MRAQGEALAIAEKAFLDNPKSSHTRDLANLAFRKAKLAEVRAVAASDSTITAKANRDFQSIRTEIIK